MQAEETIVKKFYTLSVYSDGLVDLHLKDNITIDETFALEVKTALENFRPGCKYFMLAEAEGFYMASKAFRVLMTTQKFTSFLGALAIYSKSDSLNSLHRVFNQMDVPAIPLKIFEKRDHALQWLRAHMV